MNYYLYLFGNLGLGLCVAVMLIVQVNLEEWVGQGEGRRQWQGSLLSKDGRFYYRAKCWEQSEEVCEGFKRLWKAGVVMICCVIFGLVMIVACSGMLLRFIAVDKADRRLTVALNFVGSLVYFIGYLSWTSITGIRFDNKCVETFQDSNNAKLCAKPGAVLGIVIIFFMGLQNLILVFSLYKSRNFNSPLYINCTNDLKALADLNKA